ncbi:MAG: hypothetical protein ACT4O0_17460 [Pseudonocardia sp.]
MRQHQEPVAAAVTRAGVGQPQPESAILAVSGQPVGDLQPEIRAGPLERHREPNRERRRPGRFDHPPVDAAAVPEGVRRRQLGRALHGQQRRIARVQRRLGDVRGGVGDHQAVPQQHPLRLVLDRDHAFEGLLGLVLESKVRPVGAEEAGPAVGVVLQPDPGAVLVLGRAGVPG